jgi:hypothetical protein
MTNHVLPDLPMADYLALQAWSQSPVCDIVDRCPLAAWNGSFLNPDRVPEDPNKATDAGTVAHSILLEGHAGSVVAINPNDYPSRNGNIPDGWTNKAIREARDAARAAGKIPVLAYQMKEIVAMAHAAIAFIGTLKTTEPAIWWAFQPGKGDSELTCTWEEDGVPYKIRADRINADRTLIVDAKFSGVSAEPDSWGRSQMIRMNYYCGAAFYRRGCEKVFGTSPDYVFLVQETEPPYLTSLVGVDPHAFELGAQKVKIGMDTLRQCLAAKRWPGYPPRVAYPEIPAWADAQWEQQQAQRFSAADYAGQA